MRRTILMGLCVGLLLSGAVSGAPFDALFKVTDCRGEVLVRTPDGGAFVAAEAGRAYPYGTTVRTDGKGSCVVVLSAGNQVKISADTVCMLAESQVKSTVKMISVDAGKIDVMLEENFGEANEFHILTVVATGDSGGGGCSVDVQSESDMDVATFSVSSGTIKVTGPNFAIPSMNTGDTVTISTAKDKTYSLLETVAGDVDVEVKDADGNAKLVQTKAGSIIKIWCRTAESGKMLIVTILITTPDGSLEEAITYTEEIPETPPDTDIPVPDQTTTTDPGPPVLLGRIPTSTTTTSTTFPSPTPVGLR